MKNRKKHKNFYQKIKKNEFHVMHENKGIGKIVVLEKAYL